MPDIEDPLFYMRAWAFAKGSMQVLLAAMIKQQKQWTNDDIVLEIIRIFEQAEDFARNPTKERKDG